MKYQLALNFHIDEKDERIVPFLSAAMDLFRQHFPDAKETSEPFATVYWVEDGNSPKPGIGRIDKDLF